MNKLSIKELKEMRSYATARHLERFVRVIDEAVALRETLKGDQDPFCFVSDEVMSKLSRRESCYGFMLPELDTNDRFNTPLFTAQQKPVISKEQLCDWLEDNFDIDDSQRDAFAQCFAHHCNCIVKDGD
mgnify:CR=1 FL=1